MKIKAAAGTGTRSQPQATNLSMALFWSQTSCIWVCQSI